MDLSKLLKTASSIRFPSGAFGKTCQALVMFAFACAAMVIAVRETYVALAALAIVGIVVIVTLWRLVDFAKTHPTAALLEGMEYLKHEQVILAAKLQARVPPSITTDEAEQRALPPPDPKKQEEPDPEEDDKAEPDGGATDATPTC